MVLTGCDDSAFLVGGYDGKTRFADAFLWTDDSFRAVNLVGGEHPFVGRAGHVMVRIGIDSFVVALGYESDRSLLGDAVRVTLNRETLQAALHPLAHSGNPRRWACAGMLMNESLMCVAGGWNEKGPTMDVQLYDVLRDTWSDLTCAGPGPKPRRWAASDVIGGKLVIQGGYDGAATPLGDAWALDVVAGRWMKLPWTDRRASRHTLCHGHLIGGFGENEAILRHHAVLDLENHPLENDIEFVSQVEKNWYRAGHSSVFLPLESSVLTVGGFVGGEKRRLVLDEHKKYL